MTVKVPFTDLSSYPSPTSAPLSDTNSMDAIPSDVLEFFKVKAPVCVPVVNRKSPSVPLEMVSELPNSISLPVTFRSPLISVFGASMSNLVSALISNCPSVEELIFRSESLNAIALVPFSVPIVLAVIPVSLDPSPSKPPVAVIVPVAVKLSPIVTSDVVCPIVTAIPELSVATFIVPVAFVMYEFDPS